MFRITFLLLTVLLASSCQVNNKRTSRNTTSNWSQLSSWSFNGKMAINDGNNSGSGRILWIDNKKSTKAQFKAPLGQGSWTITETSEGAKLESSNKGESTANNASILISQELGWEFPWNSLRYWVRGYQTNQALEPHLTLPNSITDNGWSITYQKWTNTPLGMLPKKIKATKDNYSVKLIIYNWNIN